MEHLAPGVILIYSTCTLNFQENQVWKVFQNKLYAFILIRKFVLRYKSLSRLIFDMSNLVKRAKIFLVGKVVFGGSGGSTTAS